jgi:hypothetical protein
MINRRTQWGAYRARLHRRRVTWSVERLLLRIATAAVLGRVPPSTGRRGQRQLCTHHRPLEFSIDSVRCAVVT